MGYRNVSDNPDTSTRTVSFSVNDGNSDSAVASKAVNIQAVNDAGILSVPSSLNFNEDASGTVSGISISDADAGSGQVTPDPERGAGPTARQQWRRRHGQHAGQRSDTGRLGSGHQRLYRRQQGLLHRRRQRQRQRQPDGDLQRWRQHGQRRGAAHSAGGDAGRGAVNDAPVNQVPSSQNVLQDGSLTFNNGNGNLISISDVDAGSAALQVTLTASNGLLTLSSLSGLVFTVGSGTGRCEHDLHRLAKRYQCRAQRPGVLPRWPATTVRPACRSPPATWAAAAAAGRRPTPTPLASTSPR
nr:hypothetical protein [Pseudomonas sp. BIGb0427]